MKKIGSWISIVSVAVVLAACGQENVNNSENDTTGEETVETLDVTLDTPETADAGEALTFTATVTQGDEKVNDAEEVMFEVWEEGAKDDSEMIEASNDGEGVYSIKKTFESGGTYFVQSHVTARNLHTMPKNEIAITAEDKATGEEDSGQEHAHAHESDVSIHLMKPDEIKTNEDINLMVHLQKGDAALTGAAVRFEISKEGEEKAEWVDTKEMKDGEYEGTTSFGEDGDYSVTIHVENDEGLHEHTEKKVIVTE
ncbi:FixH family protein [Pseudalkalibacillus hwajinpoensis]|uniref:FixH family protein n=1 Tax=Guptibacillus hwajinpoensis TaxID=208199 RepID=UPI00325BC116